MNEEENAAVLSDDRAPPPAEPALYVARAAEFGYRGDDGSTIEALCAVDLSLRAGEFLSIVGPSGCGKTTLLKMFGGLIQPTKGRFLFKGCDLKEPPDRISMAFQDPLLLPWRNVLDNVLLPIEILRRPRRDYVTKAMDLLGIVGLVGFETKAAWELSGGMRQRVSLCRALITEPEVLLLDEPFAALDAFTREDLWSVLQELQARMGNTIVLVTHQLNEAVILSDRILVMDKRPGRVVHEERISIARPRDIDQTLTPLFADHVGRLRHAIRH